MEQYIAIILLLIMVFEFKSFHLLTDYTSVFINCGGSGTTSTRGITYDDDSDPAGPTSSKEARENWGFSSTGHFLGDLKTAYSYIQRNETRLAMVDSDGLYQNARVSPISLTYYLSCLENGGYTVKLHFAEILFTDDDTFSSLGRRIFDIYIQVFMVLIITFSNT